MNLGKIWRLAEPRPQVREMLARELKISEIVAQVLVNRGITTIEAAREFLWSGLEGLHNPELLPGLNKAVARVFAAITAGEKILIYGDYDVDGITATTLLYLTLSKLGARVDYYIPDRLEEGYGLNQAALEKALEDGFSLVVTVDCGISSVDEADWALEAGLDLIITDHHEPQDQLPRALAVLNPKAAAGLQPAYPFQDLAGVGVSFKLAQGLLRYLNPRLPEGEAGREYLDLVALGTIADIVPLREENRILVKYGLEQLNSSQRPGLAALRQVCGLAGREITAGNVGFILAPRLNAGGRLGDARRGVRLLISSDASEAADIATQLEQENRRRQELEAETTAQAVAMLEAAAMDESGADAVYKDKVLVLASEGWHPGVIGIVASRLVEKYHRPTILLTLEDGIAKGSCRSIPGFDIYQALTACKQHLITFGGHKQAAGLSLAAADVQAFRQEINRWGNPILTEELLHPKVRIDEVVAFSELSLDLVAQLELLEPFGHQNPGPVLACRSAKILDSRGVGRDNTHLKLRVTGGQGAVEAIGFQFGGVLGRMRAGRVLDLAFALEKNEWNNRTNLQLVLKDIKNTALPDNPFLPPSTSRVMVDRRECPDKQAYLQEVLQKKTCGLVYVNNQHAAEETRAFLTTKGQDETVVGYWQVWGPALEAGIEGLSVEDVILYNFPLSDAEFGRMVQAIARLSGRVQIHLVYGQSDRRLNRTLLEQAIPGREFLAELYVLIRTAARQENPFFASPDGLAAQLGAGTVKVSSAAGAFAKDVVSYGFSGDGLTKAGPVLSGLQILSELGLIEVMPFPKATGQSNADAGRQRLSILFNPPPGTKLDLESAPTFRAGLAAKAEQEDLASRLLECSSNEAACLFGVEEV